MRGGGLKESECGRRGCSGVVPSFRLLQLTLFNHPNTFIQYSNREVIDDYGQA